LSNLAITRDGWFPSNFDQGNHNSMEQILEPLCRLRRFHEMRGEEGGTRLNWCKDVEDNN
jgi:hypothetical protein